VSTESVAAIPRCTECDDVWLTTDEERWEAAYLTDDEPQQNAFERALRWAEDTAPVVAQSGTNELAEDLTAPAPAGREH
jgi:hypothetical protein